MSFTWKRDGIRIDRTGKRYGRLLVVSLKRATPPVLWLCQCDCGKRLVIRGNYLSGRTRSCGCLRVDTGREKGELTAKHRDINSPEYAAWANMRDRCRNPNNHAYKNYGGRGIKVCKRWDKYENFLSDMGRRPSSKHSLDRYPDNDGDYKKSNCRWATVKEQGNNRRRRIANQ